MLGKKMKMTQIFDENGNVIPATLISAGPIEAFQIKTKEKDGYESVKFGYEAKKKKGHKFLKEFRFDKISNSKYQIPNIGENIDVSVFEVGDKVVVSGISKSKGFQGVVKRHGFHGGPRTHGQKHSEREPGSIGGGLRTRVPKGMRMAGRMGGDRITVKNLKVVKIDKDNNQIFISGAVPGRKGTLLEIYGI